VANKDLRGEDIDFIQTTDCTFRSGVSLQFPGCVGQTGQIAVEQTDRRGEKRAQCV